MAKGSGGTKGAVNGNSDKYTLNGHKIHENGANEWAMSVVGIGDGEIHFNEKTNLYEVKVSDDKQPELYGGKAKVVPSLNAAKDYVMENMKALDFIQKTAADAKKNGYEDYSSNGNRTIQSLAVEYTNLQRSIPSAQIQFGAKEPGAINPQELYDRKDSILDTVKDYMKKKR